MKRLKRGCVHIYTGSGKGKTTASIGLAMRAASSELKVCMFQFLKKRCASADSRISLPNFKIVCFNEVHPIFIGSRVKGSAFAKASADRQGARVMLKKKILCDLKKAVRAIKCGRYDIIILDEIINCVSGKFIDEEAVLEVVKAKPKRLELVLTGRGATRRLIASADYVTRLDKVKHPFDNGMFARRGIEY